MTEEQKLTVMSYQKAGMTFNQFCGDYEDCNTCPMCNTTRSCEATWNSIKVEQEQEQTDNVQHKRLTVVVETEEGLKIYYDVATLKDTLVVKRTDNTVNIIEGTIRFVE